MTITGDRRGTLITDVVNGVISTYRPGSVSEIDVPLGATPGNYQLSVTADQGSFDGLVKVIGITDSRNVVSVTTTDTDFEVDGGMNGLNIITGVNNGCSQFTVNNATGASNQIDITGSASIVEADNASNIVNIQNGNFCVLGGDNSSNVVSVANASASISGGKNSFNSFTVGGYGLYVLSGGALSNNQFFVNGGAGIIVCGTGANTITTSSGNPPCWYWVIPPCQGQGALVYN